ncbi:hypothetical protein QAD02_023551 [Eretmocerus hayati]|uniref:Uncharacterized protein n=1 Tax=Eretmocerus hayati TaxID=131215 RepID=A0ACC2PWB9_9HYME|nr:hypothetical protein QAD02_023551 [Eretmocerus hayati]
MTKTYGDISLECLRGQEYARPAPSHDKPSQEEPVLDLSFKKSPAPSPKCEPTSNDSCPPSPHRSTLSVATDFDTDRLRLQQLENNNNDNKHVNNYQQQQQQQQVTRSPSRETTPAVVRTPPLHQVQTHHRYQQQQEDTSGYSSSSIESKSPYESLRRYSLTPPSDSESHKKLKLHHHPQPQQQPQTTVYNSLGGSLLVQSTSPTQPQPIYPVFPLSSVPCMVPMSTVSPTLLSPTIASVAQQQHQQLRPTLLEGLQQFPTSSTSLQSPGHHGDEQKKAPRPFKAYPKDPLSLSMGPDVLFDQEQKKAYSDFRSRMLDSVKRTCEGTNVKMRRTSMSSKSPQPATTAATSTDDERDAAYWERRRKNNEAAKRSRDARRAKEDEIAIRAAFLEQEYIRLKYENAILRDENSKFKCLLYGR